jgi:predicted kinase
MDALGSPDRARSRVLGIASYAVLYVALDQLLAAGVGGVVESNFSHGIAERDLAVRIGRVRAVQVHCHTTPAIILQRYAARAAGGQRHHGHFDTEAETLADLEASLAGSRHEPLDLGIPLIRVETSDGYMPSLEAICVFAAGGGGIRS